MARTSIDLPLPLDGNRNSAATPYRWLLVLRFFLVNLVGAALLMAAWVQGWVGQILDVDQTHVCKLIFALFVIGMVWSAQRVAMISRELNALDGIGSGRAIMLLRDLRGRDGHTRTALIGALRLRIAHRIAPVRHMAAALVLIGLIGTIIGFVVALSGVDRNAIEDPAAIAPMIATLLAGMSMALFKTLVGSILNVWLMVNYRMLEGGAVHLLGRVIETGERDAAA